MDPVSSTVTVFVLTMFEMHTEIKNVNQSINQSILRIFPILSPLSGNTPLHLAVMMGHKGKINQYMFEQCEALILPHFKIKPIDDF